MVEDKLDREQRIRLESLNQSVASTTMQRASTKEIVIRARHFEQYIRNGAFEGVDNG